MSSLHQDRLLVEGSGPVTGTATTLPTARGKSRGAVGSTEKKATSKVSTQRLGTAQQIGTTQSTAAAPAAPRAKRGAGAKAATGVLASRAKAATVKAAAAQAATAKAAAAKAATAARAAAVTKVANHAPGVRSARAAAASAARPQATAGTGTTTGVPRPTTPAETAAKASASVTGANTPLSVSSTPAAETAAPVRSARPTPHKRPSAALSELVPLTSVAELGTADAGSDTVSVVAVRKDFPADPEPSSGTERRLPRCLRRRPLATRRRPALCLSAALAGAITLSALSAQEPTAQATATMSQSVSVAEQLGIEADATEAIVEVEATQRLGILAASRNERDAEQAAAVQVQAEADRVAAEAAAAAAAAAAEAARPKAVLPVDGARLTSGFGARWGSLHAGIDLAAPMHTPEYAAMDGVVLEAGPASGYGLVVYIQHENGDVTAYGHMDEILVTPGQVVRAGETIALLGNRGQSTGPHLHFEVHVGGLNGQKIDPLPWLRDRGVGI